MKNKFFALFVLLILFTVACDRVQERPRAIPVQTQPPPQQVPAQPVAVPPVQEPPKLIEKSILELDADDDGFYLRGDQIGLVTVKKGRLLELTFSVRTNEVYYGGLDFKGCGQEATAKPGESVTLSFVPVSNCIIKSYWPSSGVLKDSIELNVE